MAYKDCPKLTDRAQIAAGIVDVLGFLDEYHPRDRMRLLNAAFGLLGWPITALWIDNR